MHERLLSTLQTTSKMQDNRFCKADRSNKFNEFVMTSQVSKRKKETKREKKEFVSIRINKGSHRFDRMCKSHIDKYQQPESSSFDAQC